ncbi:helix-turn-helix domain-containing protein [Nitrosococcus watsonii]|uniref:helix-turn-helix domain-containing protein n=1 Tax=Nitrosococcus watsonii TaxID=473531 RepID=UPI000A0648E4|nr:helix-turn-helix domain-containing protein [Nitrosococcus watsonii]
MTKRIYGYLFYPTTEQVQLLIRTFGCVRFVYNTVLSYRTDTLYQRQEKLATLTQIPG